MNLEEVERRLRCEPPGVNYYDRQVLADAIKAHMEKLRAVWARMAAQDNVWSKEVAALLPPQKSALQRAIEMVEEDHETRRDRTGFSNTWHQSLLALLREVEKEARQ